MDHLIPVLQAGVDINAGGTTLLGSGVSAFLTTLIVGAILVALLPEYTDRMIDEVADEPLSSFLYGFAAVLLLGILTLLLVLSVVGILLAIPLVAVAYICWAAGATLAFLAIAERLVSRADGWLKPLLVAAGLNGGLALNGIGGLVSFVAGAVGFGTILRDYFG